MSNIKKITYELQGDGRDSWVIEFKNDRIPEIIYEDPKTLPTKDASDLDLSTLTEVQILELKSKLGL